MTLGSRYLRVLETERDRSLDKQQRELIGEMNHAVSQNFCNETESGLKRNRLPSFDQPSLLTD